MLRQKQPILIHIVALQRIIERFLRILERFACIYKLERMLEPFVCIYIRIENTLF